MTASRFAAVLVTDRSTNGYCPRRTARLPALAAVVRLHIVLGAGLLRVLAVARTAPLPAASLTVELLAFPPPQPAPAPPRRRRRRRNNRTLRALRRRSWPWRRSCRNLRRRPLPPRPARAIGGQRDSLSFANSDPNGLVGIGFAGPIICSTRSNSGTDVDAGTPANPSSGCVRKRAEQPPAPLPPRVSPAARAGNGRYCGGGDRGCGRGRHRRCAKQRSPATRGPLATQLNRGDFGLPRRPVNAWRRRELSRYRLFSLAGE